MKPAPISISQIATLQALVGLSLLYASAYFLPLLRPAGVYFLPSNNVLTWVVLPSLVVIIVVLAAYYVLRPVVLRWGTGRAAALFWVLLLSILAVIAVKGLFSAADSDWRYVIPLRENLVSPILLTTVQRIKDIVCVGVLLAIWAMRGHLARLTRILSSMGFAFAALALVRIFLLYWGTAHAGIPPAPSPTPSATASARQVVWVIFDETDFNRVFAQDRKTQVALPNFARLSQLAVTAKNANSPAGATIYSIPALLTGTSMTGTGVRFDNAATLSIERQNESPLRFDEATSIFGSVRAQGGKASILGFYHPYCRLFDVAHCDSFAWPRVGGWLAALEANLPDAVSSGDSWDSITQKELKLLPEYLARDEDLTFIHLNFPHPPADYADRALHLPPSTDPSIEYSHNLLFTDRVLGDIMRNLQARQTRRETLLIVSTDHWLRNLWFHANEKERSRPITFFAWRVGETTAYEMAEPVSTVHTAAMILEYLRGGIDTQADIAGWWKNQTVIPSFIPQQ